MMYYCAFFAVHRLVQYNHLFVGCTVMVHKLFGRETVREHWLRRVANGLLHQHSRQVGGYCATLGPEHVVHACCVRAQHRAAAQVWIGNVHGPTRGRIPLQCTAHTGTKHIAAEYSTTTMEMHAAAEACMLLPPRCVRAALPACKAARFRCVCCGIADFLLYVVSRHVGGRFVKTCHTTRTAQLTIANSVRPTGSGSSIGRDLCPGMQLFSMGDFRGARTA